MEELGLEPWSSNATFRVLYPTQHLILVLIFPPVQDRRCSGERLVEEVLATPSMRLQDIGPGWSPNLAFWFLAELPAKHHPLVTGLQASWEP